jgi:hypothetical protein
VPPDALQEVLDQVPVKLSMAAKTEGCWEVRERGRKQGAQLQRQWVMRKQAGSNNLPVACCWALARVWLAAGWANRQQQQQQYQGLARKLAESCVRCFLTGAFLTY